MSTKLGDKIRALRKEKQLTLDELAAAAGISKSYLWELENRPSPKPSAEKLDALAKVLGKPVSYFLDEGGTTPEEEYEHEAFFRNYKELEPEDRDRVRMIVESFKGKRNG
jgi:transcriptional regulator with XRE-family HTH domain